jgi:ribosomal-protein-alanine N-acetyltransferase
MMAGLLQSWFAGWRGGGIALVEPAGARDAARLAQLHGASFHRGWGEGEFETMLTERNTLVDRLRQGRQIIGFAVSRIAADEAEILSIAIDANQRGRGRRGDCMNGPDSASLGAGNAIISSPAGSN